MEEAIITHWICTILYSLFGVLGLFYFFKKGYRTPINEKEKKYRYIILCILIVSICNSFGGDYWGYKDGFINGIIREDNDELVWSFLYNVLPKYYFLFRFVVWGTGLFVFVKICDKLQINKLFVGYIFLIFYIFTFSYARVSFGYMITYFVLCDIVCTDFSNKNGLLKRLLLWSLLLFIAFNAHSTIRFLFLVIALSQIIKFSRKNITILLILFPVFWFLMKSSFSIELFSNYISSEKIVSKAESYMLSEYASNNTIEYIIPYIPILALFAVAIYYLILYNDCDNAIKRFANAAFLVAYISFLFLSVDTMNTNIFFYRFMDMAYPPMLIVIAYSFSKYKINGNLLIIMTLWAFARTWIALASTAIHPEIIIRNMIERL